MKVTFTAFGIPAPQGSAQAFIRGGRAIVTHDGGSRSKVQSWRSVLAAEAAVVMQGKPLIDDAVAVKVVFVLPKPKAAVKERREWPDRKPDLDKLARACGDAIKGIIYTEDSRICRWSVEKVYGEPARAIVEVETLGPERVEQHGLRLMAPIEEGAHR